jgi:hypothetical protein
MNTYPLSAVVAIDDDVLNPQFAALVARFPNITWVSTNVKVGQLYAIDLLYSFIKTEYFFHSEEDFVFLLPGFIERSL